MATLNEVKFGLANGRSYKRYFGDTIFGGEEYVRSLFDGRHFEHTVAGKDSGGVAECDISVMTPDRWENDGWILLED